MPRSRRHWVSQEEGAFHIISRTAGGDILFHEEEKEYFLKLMERLAAGFFVRIHAFCIMGNHFHILASSLDLDAEKAGVDELLLRYQLIYGANAKPPIGFYEENGCLIPDKDQGIERLRRRLGSISRFVQELKQTFSRWYNKKNGRKGYLWSDRFKGVIVDKGEAQLVCSAYIDLNPVRANIVKQPEDYRWCSLGLRVRNQARANRLLDELFEKDAYRYHTPDSPGKGSSINDLSWYREFVYLSGGIPREGKGHIAPGLVESVQVYHGKLKIGDNLAYRVRNISEGLAIGSYSFISNFQGKLKRKFIRPRILSECNVLYATRVLRDSVPVRVPG